MKKDVIYIGSDHAGFDLKEAIKKSFPNIQWKDFGVHHTQKADYPDIADQVINESIKDSVISILVCGSGQGMAMKANRNPQIRAALCWDVVTARLARAHNDANVLCIGGRLIPIGLAIEIVREFLNTPFEGGRHQARVQKLFC